MKLKPANLTAQIHHRGAGNPSSVLPRSAISNCFPGLEFDFRAFWRRTFVGIVLLEHNNYVVAAEDPQYEDLVTRRLVRVDGLDTGVVTEGPTRPHTEAHPLATTANPNGVSFMEWSNSLARIMTKQGQKVNCEFTAHKDADQEVLAKDTKVITVELTMRRFFEGASPAIAMDMVQPGELTQGLCAPWQNDYRECACYYWAASRPDYVNVGVAANGLSHGDMWLAKARTGAYVPDDYADLRLWSYDDLFSRWEHVLKFIVNGRDVDDPTQ